MQLRTNLSIQIAHPLNTYLARYSSALNQLGFGRANQLRLDSPCLQSRQAFYPWKIQSAKSHQHIRECKLLEERWISLGKDAANKAAQQARIHLNANIQGLLTGAYEVMSKIATQCAAEQDENSAPTPGEQIGQDLACFPKETCHKIEIPPFTEECKDEAYWGVTFMMRLHAWVSMLRW